MHGATHLEKFMRDHKESSLLIEERWLVQQHRAGYLDFKVSLKGELRIAWLLQKT
jgi:hypothetical protein